MADKSIGETYLAKYWDSDNNGEMNPMAVSLGSAIKIAWVCEHGHHFTKKPHDLKRYVDQGDEHIICPYCNNRRILKGFNDLATLRPDVTGIWDTDANDAEGLSIYSVGVGSGKMAHWVCPKGHKWVQRIHDKITSINPDGCPVCDGTGHILVKGGNDLASVNPALAAQWDEKRNGKPASEVLADSSVKAWWICGNGHSWQAVVSSRTRGNGCPVCSRRITVKGINDLESCNPELMKEWDYDRNGKLGLHPNRIPSSSEKHAWWICGLCGHRWKARINNRVQGTGCPACTIGAKGIVIGVNDLATTDPDIAKQWDVKANNGIPPTRVRAGSNLPAHWECPKGHKWVATPYDRTGKHNGCPYCSGRVASPGESDLETLYPGFMLDWDRDLNTVDPASLRPGSEVRVHWRCHVCGHRWESGLSHRTGTRPHGCPKCMRGMPTSRGERELADFCASLVGEDRVVRNDRTMLSPADNGVRRELDVWVPSRMVAVEFNGVHWHTEALRGRTYHHDKYEECRSLGIRLLQVWDDDWARRRPVVEDHLRTVLDCGAYRRVDARRCRVVPDIPVACMRAFMEANHIQGYGPGSVRFALMDGDVMVAGLVGSLSAGVLDVVRYATPLGVLVRGGFSRLLSHAVGATGVSHVATFSDNMVSDGGLYRRTGFHEERAIPPDYSYVRPDEGVRMHKFGFRVSRFRSDPSLLYRPGLTESQLATMNGLERVYDAGKVRWGMDV